jgi:hypothetical protein
MDIHIHQQMFLVTGLLGFVSLTPTYALRALSERVIKGFVTPAKAGVQELIVT